MGTQRVLPALVQALREGPLRPQWRGESQEEKAGGRWVGIGVGQGKMSLKGVRRGFFQKDCVGGKSDSLTQ